MNVALRSDHLNLISICTGGGGLDLGVELAIPDARTVCMVEREGFAVATLASAMEAGLMAPAPIWSDARTFDGRAWRGAVDGLIGGIPCQPHSLAGKKRGQHDERDLWSTARRIIVQSGAWFVLIENVAGMLSAGADEIAGAERVWRDLRKLGFKVEIGLFTAAEVGASHERERVFILGVADAGRSGPQRGEWRRTSGEWDRPASSRPITELRGAPLVHAERAERRADAVEGHEPDWNDGGRRQAAGRIGEPGEVVDSANVGEVQGDTEGEGWSEHGAAVSGRCSLPTFPPGPGDIDGWRTVLQRAPELEPAFRRVADGLAAGMGSRVDELRMLGNGVVPLQAAYALRTLVTRLAARGSAGAARLVRMMEAAE